MGDFRKLEVWQEGQQLAILTYHVTGAMWNRRTSALCDQIMRAAMSVTANIVEGNAHESPREFVRFLHYSRASATEVEGHIQLALDIGIMTNTEFAAMSAHVGSIRRMLNAFIPKVRARIPKKGMPSRDRPFA
jgi:four helix bundle protein